MSWKLHDSMLDFVHLPVIVVAGTNTTISRFKVLQGSLLFVTYTIIQGIISSEIYISKESTSYKLNISSNVMILWHFCLLLLYHSKDNLNTSHRATLQDWHILWVAYQHFVQCLQEEIFSAALSEMESKMYKYSLHWSDSCMSSGPGVYNTQMKCCNRMCLSTVLHPSKTVLAGLNSHRQGLNKSQSSFRAYQW